MNIPRPDHPVWRRLVTGEVLFQPSFLGACMFLANVRADRRRRGVRTALHMEQLRTLYARNQDCNSVRQDLAALRMNEIFMADPDCGGWFKEEARSSGMSIPPPDHPVWQRLVSGAVLFQPSFLGACMLLAHLRADLQQPSPLPALPPEGGGLGRGMPGDERGAVLHMRQLRALYANNVECGSVQRDLVRLRMNEIFTADSDCGAWFHAERESVQRDLLRLRMSIAARGRSAAAARRRPKFYTMTVVAADGGGEYELPADTVTRDEPAAGTRGPYVPLAFRPQGDVFYVCTARWSQLAGMPLRLQSAPRARACGALRSTSQRT